MNVYILFWNGGFKALAFVISSHKSKVSRVVFQQSYFLISWGSVTSEIHGFFMVALSNVWAGNMTEYMQLRINDAHHMFWIFSSWCVKGELGLRDSRLGTSPEGEEAERQKGIERLIWYSSYVLCPSLVWTVSQEEGGGGVIHLSKHAHRCTQKPHMYEHYFWFRSAGDWKVLVSLLWYYSPVISRTVRNTLSFSGSKASILW